ncbi:MAG: hypothetical protein DDT30_00852 [Dehalococcoidia bacterium]|nr:hypothetical protein [Bacillota bacterium]
MQTSDQLTTFIKVIYSAGRKYLFAKLGQIAAGIDFQRFPDKDLEPCTQDGHVLLRNIESYRSCDQQFGEDYLGKILKHDIDFPDLYIFMLAKLSPYPLIGLCLDMSTIIVYQLIVNQLADKEIKRRIKERPELDGMLTYQCLTAPVIKKAFATNKQLAEEIERQFGTRDEAFEKVWGTLRPFAGAHLGRYLRDDDANQEAQKGLFLGMEQWAKGMRGIIKAGLTGELWRSLNKDAQRGVDAWRKREERVAGHQTDGGLGISGGEKPEMLEIELDKKALNEHEVQKYNMDYNMDIAEHEGYDLHGLSRQKSNLILNKLTPKERRLLQDVVQGLEEHDFDSKLGMSMKLYWGEDYPRKIKAWNRLRRKLQV